MLKLTAKKYSGNTFTWVEVHAFKVEDTGAIRIVVYQPASDRVASDIELQTEQLDELIDYANSDEV